MIQVGSEYAPFSLKKDYGSPKIFFSCGSDVEREVTSVTKLDVFKEERVSDKL